MLTKAARGLTRRRRFAQDWFDLLSLKVMYGFARWWHGCVPAGTIPLPPSGPAIVIANHPSPADPALLLSASPRPLRFLHARDSYEVFLLRRLFMLVGSIPVTHHGPNIGAVRAALNRLRDGEVLCVFPEGDISPLRGGMLPARRGAALLALRTGAPVYPVWITRTRPRRHVAAAWLCPSRGARLAFGEPVDLSAYAGRPITSELLDEVTAVLVRRIVELGNPETAEAESARDGRLIGTLLPRGGAAAPRAGSMAS